MIVCIKSLAFHCFHSEKVRICLKMRLYTVHQDMQYCVLQKELKQKDNELQEIITDAQQAVDEERQKLYEEFTQQKDEQCRKLHFQFNEELNQRDQEIQHLHAILEGERQKMSMLESDLQVQFLQMKEVEVQQIYMQLEQQMKEKCEQMKREYQMELEQLYIRQ